MDPNNLGQPNTPTNTPGGAQPQPPQTPPVQPQAQQPRVVGPQQAQPFDPYASATGPTDMPDQPIQMSPMSSGGGGRMRRLLVALLALIVVIAIGAAVYFVMFKDDSSNDAAKKSTKSAEKSAISMDTLNSVTLALAATDATGLKEKETGVAGFKTYVSDDELCAVSVGIVKAADLPGADLNAMIEPQLKALRDAGAAIDGPDAGKALILKDAADSKTTYSMPTLVFDFSKDNQHALTHYSAVILKNTDRAVVSRICANKEGTVDQNKLTNLDNIAAKAKVTEQ